VQTLKTDYEQVKKTGENAMSKLKSFFNKWRLFAIFVILVYLIGVYLLFPLASLYISTVNYPNNNTPYNSNGVIITQDTTNLIDRNYFEVGDIAVFTFNITNTHDMSISYVFNSSITYSQYGYPQTFTLNASQSKTIVEELPVNTQGSNGFLFVLTAYYPNSSSTDSFSLPTTINAVSMSDELSLISSQSTFLLYMLLGAFALVAAVKEFKELGNKEEQNSTSNVQNHQQLTQRIRVCNYCDGENPSDNIFCSWCGRKLKATAASHSEK
jgi:signal peptidase I